MKKTIILLVGLTGCASGAVVAPAGNGVSKNTAPEFVVYQPDEATNNAAIKLNGKIVCSLPGASYFTLSAKPGINHITAKTSDIAVDTKTGNHYYIRIAAPAEAVDSIENDKPYSIESVSEELAKDELASLTNHACGKTK